MKRFCQQSDMFVYRFYEAVEDMKRVVNLCIFMAHLLLASVLMTFHVSLINCFLTFLLHSFYQRLKWNLFFV